MKVYLIAGEASGDVLGSFLMKSLRAHAPQGVTFYGIGGKLMEAEGLRSLFPVHELSVMGIAEVLPRLQKILARIKETADHIRGIDPDIVITIDAPDFCFRVVRSVQKQAAAKRPLFIHYVAPTVWAWRPERAKKIADLYDGILCLFPFEPPFFQKHGLPAGYVGHPVMEQGYVDASGAAVRAEFGIDAETPVLGLMFGSREGEVARHGAILREAAEKLQATNPQLHFLAPTLPHIESAVRQALSGIHNVHVTCDSARKPEIFAAMTAAVAVSGTVALELAVANVPHVIAYRMSPLTYQIVRRLVRVRFAHLANILLNKGVVPEFIQDECTADNIVAGIRPFLKVGNDVDNQCAEFATVRKLLNGKTKEPPSVQAAQFVLELYRQKTDKTFVPYAKAS
ncbi:MAG: lipid-A-disaccharide synthase [Micavibrio aeruginosavorus]|nr:lipid-A-disaccharide synthase [Micavibrio aeruginosavorus]